MKRKHKIYLYVSLCFIFAFAVWTVLVKIFDVGEIGPEGSAVGFSAMNGFFHKLTGVNMTLYDVTDILGIVPLLFVFGFAVLGLCQSVKRKSILKVDRNILMLGGFYAVMSAVYIFFEVFVINSRPVLIDGILEASYPSSTTLLIMCVMPTAVIQLRHRIKNKAVERCVCFAITLFSAFMVVARFVSGVHWASDIIGGMLLSTGLVGIYRYLNKEE